MTDRNRELFHKIADKIEAKPELYDQEWFSRNTKCGTAHCIAGWAVALDDDNPTFDGDIWGEGVLLLGLVGSEDMIFDSTWMEGESVGAVVAALRAIGDGADVEDYL